MIIIMDDKFETGSLYKLVRNVSAYIGPGPNPSINEFRKGEMFVMTSIPEFHRTYNDELIVSMLYKGQVNMFNFYHFDMCSRDQDRFEQAWDATFERVY